ncbi:MAG: M1 family metallopeptidase [Rhodothermales bacterium]
MFFRVFRRSLLLLAALFATSGAAFGQHWLDRDTLSRTNRSIFRPLEDWPAPTEYRNAAGSPGPSYWQQRVDYRIRASLDTLDHVVSGSEHITYHNNSPDELRYLWIQLDQNVRSPEHSRSIASRGAVPGRLSPAAIAFQEPPPFDGGDTLERVQLMYDGILTDATYRINDTVMKVHLKEPLPPGQIVELEIDWSFPVPDNRQNARGERQLVSDGWLYEIAQWFPRLCVYDDVNGWQTDQFMGQGEFYLQFGDYDVEITVPHNHVVQATGVLQNPEDVLTPTQQSRLKQAFTSESPQFIIRPEEVMTAAARPSGSDPLTWHFYAENVRDFAWVSSKAYAWDAAGFRYSEDRDPIEAHSLYPREAMPLWHDVSTRAIIQTFKTYGRMALEYPYPKAVNVHGPVPGMEYPMVAFCGVRPQQNGAYSRALERALASVTIHEVGHNWFPMIVASDERKWTWMDEGINSFLEYYAEQDWEPGFPSGDGPAKNVVAYMRESDQVPIMTYSDLIHKDFGDNAYAKPAAGLVMLREHILSPPVFDEAFHEYVRKWSFKHPQPTDFFRSIEEGAGEDLSWFWRGWFYTTHANDQAVSNVSAQASNSVIGQAARGANYYRITIKNEGGIVMPVQIDISYSDGSKDRFDLPVDVWRNNEIFFTKGFFTNKTVARVVVDPDNVFADINRENNIWELPQLHEGERTGD